jgi:hypothetical protein
MRDAADQEQGRVAATRLIHSFTLSSSHFRPPNLRYSVAMRNAYKLHIRNQKYFLLLMVLLIQLMVLLIQLMLDGNAYLINCAVKSGARG